MNCPVAAVAVCHVFLIVFIYFIFTQTRHFELSFAFVPVCFCFVPNIVLLFNKLGYDDDDDDAWVINVD